MHVNRYNQYRAGILRRELQRSFYLKTEKQQHSLDACTPEQYVWNYFEKKNQYYTCAIAPKRTTNSGAHLRGSAPEQHSSEET